MLFKYKSSLTKKLKKREGEKHHLQSIILKLHSFYKFA